MSDSKCPNCGNGNGIGACVCQVGMARGQQAAAMIDPVKTRELLDRIQSLPRSESTPELRRQVRDTERRLRSLAREAIRCAVRSIALTRKDDGNRVDTAVLKRALEAYAEFQDALDPQTFIAILDREGE